jgi:hypothetical protein
VHFSGQTVNAFTKYDGHGDGDVIEPDCQALLQDSELHRFYFRVVSSGNTKLRQDADEQCSEFLWPFPA